MLQAEKCLDGADAAYSVNDTVSFDFLNPRADKSGGISPAAPFWCDVVSPSVVWPAIPDLHRGERANGNLRTLCLP